MNRVSNNQYTYNNNVSFNGKNEGKMLTDDIIQNGINKLAQRAEREMAEYGDFAPIVEKMPNHNKDLKIGEPSIKIVYANYSKDKTLKRLELDVPSESGKSNANYVLELANKQDILKVLADKNLATRIKNDIQDAAESFEERNFA